MQLITAILRGFQAICAIVVLGVSVDLARGQAVDTTFPAVTGYACFTGGFGLLVAIVGIASFFVSALEGLVTLALDAVSGLAFLAGGIAYAVLLRDTNCGDVRDTWDNVIISGGCATKNGEKGCYWWGRDAHMLKTRCTSAKADDAFMFISFAICLAAALYSFLCRGKSSSVSYA